MLYHVVKRILVGGFCSGSISTAVIQSTSDGKVRVWGKVWEDDDAVKEAYDMGREGPVIPIKHWYQANALHWNALHYYDCKLGGGTAFLLNVLKNDNYNTKDTFNTVQFYKKNKRVSLLLGVSLKDIKKVFEGKSLTSINTSKTISLGETTATQPGAGVGVQPAAAATESCPFLLSNKKINDLTQYRDVTKPDWKLKHSRPQLLAAFEKDKSVSDFSQVEYRDYGVYSPVERKDVHLIYAAQDLSINKDLLDMTADVANVRKNLAKVVSKKHSEVEWITTHPTTSKKFAMDFAVIRVDVNPYYLNSDLKLFLQKFFNRDDSEHLLMGFDRLQYALEEDENISNLFVGGVEKWGPDRADIEYMNTMVVKAWYDTSILTTGADGKAGKERKVPSQINLSNFSEYIKIDGLPTGYTVVPQRFIDFDGDGALVVEYKIKNSKDHLSTKMQKMTVIHLPTTAGVHQHKETREWREQDSNNVKVPRIREHLKPIASWFESLIKKSRLDRRSINQVASGVVGVLPPSKTETSDNYFYLDHEITVPGLSFEQSGLVVKKKGIKGKLVNELSSLFGWYTGSSEWSNPLSKGVKRIGRIVPFVSPTRYNVIDFENSFTKPSLLDTLAKVNMDRVSTKDASFSVTDSSPTHLSCIMDLGMLPNNSTARFWYKSNRYQCYQTSDAIKQDSTAEYQKRWPSTSSTTTTAPVAAV